VAASERRHIMSIDVVSAFLEVELDERTVIINGTYHSIPGIHQYSIYHPGYHYSQLTAYCWKWLLFRTSYVRV